MEKGLGVLSGSVSRVLAHGGRGVPCPVSRFPRFFSGFSPFVEGGGVRVLGRSHRCAWEGQIKVVRGGRRLPVANLNLLMPGLDDEDRFGK